MNFPIPKIFFSTHTNSAPRFCSEEREGGSENENFPTESHAVPDGIGNSGNRHTLDALTLT